MTLTTGRPTRPHARRGKIPIAKTPEPACPDCTTPGRCGSKDWKIEKGPRCVGRADGPDTCDCINHCGDDPWVKDGRATPCPAAVQRAADDARAEAIRRNTESAVWTPLPGQLPDADITVMLSLDDSHGEPTFPGYYDGAGWRDVHGEPVVGVLGWTHMLQGLRKPAAQTGARP